MLPARFKFKTCLLSLLATTALTNLTGLLSAHESCEEPTQECTLCEQCTPCCFSRPLVEFKAGYFFFLDSILRKVYNKGGIDIQFCGSYPLCCLNDRWTLNAYGAVEYFHKSGKSINGHQKTSVWAVPVNVGLKPVYTIRPDLFYYFALGPRFYYLHQHNNSSFVNKDRSKSGVGLFVNSGFHYALCDGWMIDLFGEYSYAKMRFRSKNPRIYTRNIQIGGLTFGGGIGYAF